MHGRFHTNSDQIRTSTAWDLEGNDGSLVIVEEMSRPLRGANRPLSRRQRTDAEYHQAGWLAAAKPDPSEPDRPELSTEPTTATPSAAPI